MSSEVELPEAATVSDTGSAAGETESVLVSGDDQTEDDGNVSALSEVQPVIEVVATDATAASEDKPAADDDRIESSADCKTNDDGKQSSADQADSSISEQCTQMVSTTRSRGGRSYQESRRSKKTSGEKSKCASCEVVDSHDLDAGCLEQKGKGDVRDAELLEEDSVMQMKELVCHPTCDGDPPALVNVIIDEHDMRKRSLLTFSSIHCFYSLQ